MDKVIYVPGERWVQEYATERADGVIVGWQTGKTLNEIQREFPTAVIIGENEAADQIESLAKTEPRRIDKKTFKNALEMLPPDDWVFDRKFESFKCSERTTGRVTAIYVSIGAFYWMFHDLCTMSHSEIIERVWEAEQKQIVE